MKEFFKEILSADNMKKAMISMLFSNPNLTAGEYARLSKELRDMENNINQEIQTQVEIEKAS